MEALIYILHWGSPVGMGLFFFLGCSGVGILFWGIGHFNKSRNEK